MVKQPNSADQDASYNLTKNSLARVPSSDPQDQTSGDTRPLDASPAPHPTFGSVLSQPAVRALWLATLISYLGDSFSAMALLILVNHVTQSTVALATVAVAETVPILFAVITGALVDRWRYRPVLLAADLLRAALVPLYLLFRSAQDLWIVITIVVGISVASRFFFPASSALRRMLVRPEEYKITSSLWQATWALSLVAGPLLAGLLISAFPNVETGIAAAFIIDSLSFAVSALIIFAFVGREARAADASLQGEERSRSWDDISEGLRTMAGSKPMRAVAILYAVGMLGVGSVFVLVVPYVQREFQGGPLQIGLLETAMACGILIGAAGVGTEIAGRVATGHLMLGASVIGAASVACLGLVPAYVLALVLLVFMGATAGTVQSIAGAVVLNEVPQRHQGKANSTLNMLLSLANMASMGLAGLFAALFGVRGTFVIGGLVALLGVVLATPLLAHYRSPEQIVQQNLSTQVRDEANQLP